MISSVSTLAKLKFIPTRTSVIEYFVDASLFKSRSMIGFFVELSSLLLSKEYRDKPRITNEFTQGFILVFRKLLHVEMYGIPINKKKNPFSRLINLDPNFSSINFYPRSEKRVHPIAIAISYRHRRRATCHD